MGPADTRGKRQSKGVQPAGLCPLSTRHAAPPHERCCYSLFWATGGVRADQQPAHALCVVRGFSSHHILKHRPAKEVLL